VSAFDGSEVLIVRLQIDPAAELAPALGILDEEERARASRFVREDDRRRFVLSHSELRRRLGTLLERAPGELRFEAGAHGKPRLRGAGGDVRFSLSHSGDYVLIGIARGREVGVDIECRREVDALALARRFFARTESARLEGLDPGTRTAAFFRIWTRKESFVKATGLGFSFPLHSVDVDPSAADDPLVVEAAGEDGLLGRWEIRSLDAPAGYSAAVTTARHPSLERGGGRS
jgi:4'-phosphopantetheinyl transferase